MYGKNIFTVHSKVRNNAKIRVRITAIYSTSSLYATTDFYPISEQNSMNLLFFSVLILAFVFVNGYHSHPESFSNLSESTSLHSPDAPYYSNTDCMCPNPCDQGYRGSRPQCISALEK
ncbi:hypothetical protein GEMRC1_005161 [Eukaryota sp. GEM-RC1]